MWFLIQLAVFSILVLGCGGDPGDAGPSSDENSSSGGGFGVGPGSTNPPGDGVVPSDGDGTPSDGSNTSPDGGGDDPPTNSQWDDLDPSCGYGSIHGLICSHQEQAFVNGAHVWVDTTDCAGNPIMQETWSDGEGFYTLDLVPSGIQTVHVAHDDWTKEYGVQVNGGKVSDVTAVGYKECFQVVDDQPCTASTHDVPVDSTVVTGMADIIVAIDTSGSMDAETSWVQKNMNKFAQDVAALSIDYHVILIADDEVCIPAPLSNLVACQSGDDFLHVNQDVDSHDALERIIDTYPKYKHFLRAGATTNFIVISDDNADSDEDAGWFWSKASGKADPGFSEPFVFHSIVADGNVPFIGCWGGAAKGLEYLALSDDTGGLKFSICEQDWGNLSGILAASVAETVQSACVYAVPAAGQATQAASVVLTYHPQNQNTIMFPAVAGPSDCGAGGWYFDDPQAPTQIILCSSTCGDLNGGVLQLDYVCSE